ncbi:MAG: hypothetical protein KAS13_00165 [Candidatus Omnitrophica bacterium]|nr:hypothetical protein [Candidatus Omnitrophota bacterium]
MLKHLENENRYIAHLENITENDARKAYFYIIGASACLKNYVCYPSEHGYIKDFRFEYNKNWYFAFIPNQKWLLFYFRLPCQNNPKYSREAIVNNFPEVDENNNGEYKLSILNIDMAVRVMSYIAG